MFICFYIALFNNATKLGVVKVEIVNLVDVGVRLDGEIVSSAVELEADGE